MGAGAGLPDGRAEICRATLGVRQEDRPRAGYRTSFGARIREKIARPRQRQTVAKGRLAAPFLRVEEAAWPSPGRRERYITRRNNCPRISMSRTANPVFDWADPLLVEDMLS